METRATQTFTPPHTQPESLLTRCIEQLMQLTYQHPSLMKYSVYGLGVISGLALIPAPMLGTAGILSAFVIGFAQQRMYGLPVSDDQQFYSPNYFEYETAKAVVTMSDDALPKLSIEAIEPYDAGYVEGYILAEAIKDNIERTWFLYPAMRMTMGAPSDNDDLRKYLDKSLQTIPKLYQDEMRGKVDGYNDWLMKHFPDTEALTFEHYLLLQLLPDLINYNPFTRNASSQTIAPKMGCTTIALRLGDYTFLTRVLDWPAHNVAGKSFLQVERKIGDTARTIDIGLPLLSGAATVLNEHGLLIEINISLGDQVIEPAGMPAFFFNRYCAEHAVNVKDIENLIQDKQPVGSYHLTATDGCDTESFHFYQHPDVENKHVIESLKMSHESAKLMVVANHGLQHQGDTSKATNHCDSDQRKNNIHQFFNHHKSSGTFDPYITKQRDSDLNQQNIEEIKELLLQVARLPLVNNCESVLCAMYVYHHHKLVDASVSTDNMYAQNKELSQFKRLSF